MIAIQENVPLAPFTSLEIGGPARFFVTVRTLAELREALLFARGKALPFRVIGGGTNLLVGDLGFQGVVLRLDLQGLRVTGRQVEAEAGVELNALVRQTAQWGLSGMESLAGIPGLLGGAVRGNAGAYGGSIAEVTERVSALDSETLELLSLEREACAFSYRNSLFKREPRFVVVSALLSLSPAPPAEAIERVEATIAKRSARQLHCLRSVGSFFMNPVVADAGLIGRFESEQRVRCRDGRIPAGWLIDRAGLRDSRVGAAMVSALHANYLINGDGASAEEMVRLATLIKRGVLAAMGVRLQEEVSYLGIEPPECWQEETPSLPVTAEPAPEQGS